ncbi:putative mitochondrial chaperone BCS1-B [Cytospora mali]|uniref:Mitochondrial chaperone BCS1-B n=1 Tax=Cytospora mali TaxID=578113 RepID=A0A194W9H6_CYTMA|nr:putative mitochondrial chaperone BCS1-B [Valsa mali]
MSILTYISGLSPATYIWPLLLNWRSIISFFPALESSLGGLDLDMERLIQSFLGTWCGFILVSILVITAMVQSIYWAWEFVSKTVLDTWYAKCSVATNSDMYEHILEWISLHPEFKSRRLFLVPWPADISGEESFRIKWKREGDSDSDGEIGIGMPDGDPTDVGRRIKEKEPIYLPVTNKLDFWLGGSYFWMNLRKEKILSWKGYNVPTNFLDIYCFTWNRSNKPIKDLLKMIRQHHAARRSHKTVIWAPNHEDQEDWSWKEVSRRNKRSIDTVIIDKQQLNTIINDFKTFLSGPGIRWYKERGLPLRLGYLFSGPPGTGKSSMAFALAGKFGLPIYMLNLAATKLTDAALEDLFSNLPFHSIILLEDIDATKSMTRKSSEPEEQDDNDGDDDKQKEKKKKQSCITLSGLLNAIDGVAASEGRILIMTTNHIELLDEALIRTGRADRIITFTNATRQMAQDLYIHAYTGTRWIQRQADNANEPSINAEGWTDEDIQALSKEFAAKIQDEEFSPALLQQYFKDFRAEPRRAVRELEDWAKDPRGYRKREVSSIIDAKTDDFAIVKRRYQKAGTEPHSPETIWASQGR